MGRSPCCDKSQVKKGPWSPQEDEILKTYLHNHGTGGNWITLPQKAGLKRCGKSCRLRWLNYLRPDIKHGSFTTDEDNIIYTLYTKMGSRWSTIASHLPGRTDNDVKNHWNTKLKKKFPDFLAQKKTELSPPTPRIIMPFLPGEKNDDNNIVFSEGISNFDSISELLPSGSQSQEQSSNSIVEGFPLMNNGNWDQQEYSTFLEAILPSSEANLFGLFY